MPDRHKGVMVRVPEDVRGLLQHLAEVEERTQTQVIRRALRAYADAASEFERIEGWWFGADEFYYSAESQGGEPVYRRAHNDQPSAASDRTPIDREQADD